MQLLMSVAWLKTSLTCQLVGVMHSREFQKSAGYQRDCKASGRSFVKLITRFTHAESGRFCAGSESDMDRVIFLARHNSASEGKDTHSVILIQYFCLHDGRYAYRRLHAETREQDQCAA